MVRGIIKTQDLSIRVARNNHRRGLVFSASMKLFILIIINTVKPRYNAGRGRKNFEAKNRVIARSAL